MPGTTEKLDSAKKNEPLRISPSTEAIILKAISSVEPKEVERAMEALGIPEFAARQLNDEGLTLRLAGSYIESKKKFEQALESATKIKHTEESRRARIGLFDLMRTAVRDPRYHDWLITKAFGEKGLASTETLELKDLLITDVEDPVEVNERKESAKKIRLEMTERYIIELTEYFDNVDGPSDTKVEWHNQIGLFASDKGELDDALEHYKKAEEMCRDLIEEHSEDPEALIRFKKRLSRVLNVRGVLLESEGDFTKATSLQQEALSLAEEVSESELENGIINDSETLRAKTNPLFSLAEIHSKHAENNQRDLENLGDELLDEGALSDSAERLIKSKKDHLEKVDEYLQQIEDVITRKTAEGKTKVLDPAHLMLLEERKTR